MKEVFLSFFDFKVDGAEVAQLVEHVHGKDEVTGSTPVLGSKMKGIERQAV